MGPFGTRMDDLVHRASCGSGLERSLTTASGRMPMSSIPVPRRCAVGDRRDLPPWLLHGAGVSDVDVTADNRGIIRVLHSSAEIGQGLYAMLTRVASVTLGIPESQIEVVLTHTPICLLGWHQGSRDTVSMGMAAAGLRGPQAQQLVEVAVKAIGGRPNECQFAAGQLWHGERPYPLGSVISTLAHSPVVRGEYLRSTPHALITSAKASSPLGTQVWARPSGSGPGDRRSDPAAIRHCR